MITENRLIEDQLRELSVDDMIIVPPEDATKYRQVATRLKMSEGLVVKSRMVPGEGIRMWKPKAQRVLMQP